MYGKGWIAVAAGLALFVLLAAALYGEGGAADFVEVFFTPLETEAAPVASIEACAAIARRGAPRATANVIEHGTWVATSSLVTAKDIEGGRASVSVLSIEGMEDGTVLYDADTQRYYFCKDGLYDAHILLVDAKGAERDLRMYLRVE